MSTINTLVTFSNGVSEYYDFPVVLNSSTQRIEIEVPIGYQMPLDQQLNNDMRYAEDFSDLFQDVNHELEINLHNFRLWSERDHSFDLVNNYANILAGFPNAAFNLNGQNMWRPYRSSEVSTYFFYNCNMYNAFSNTSVRVDSCYATNKSHMLDGSLRKEQMQALNSYPSGGDCSYLYANSNATGYGYLSNNTTNSAYEYYNCKFLTQPGSLTKLAGNAAHMYELSSIKAKLPESYFGNVYNTSYMFANTSFDASSSLSSIAYVGSTNAESLDASYMYADCPTISRININANNINNLYGYVYNLATPINRVRVYNDRYNINFYGLFANAVTEATIDFYMNTYGPVQLDGLLKDIRATSTTKLNINILLYDYDNAPVATVTASDAYQSIYNGGKANLDGSGTTKSWTASTYKTNIKQWSVKYNNINVIFRYANTKAT